MRCSSRLERAAAPPAASSERPMDLASQGVDGYAGSRKARGGTDAEGPARAEGIRHPADDRCANRRAAERDADAKRHHPSAHRRFGRELHQAVRRIAEVRAATPMTMRAVPKSQ